MRGIAYNSFVQQPVGVWKWKNMIFYVGQSMILAAPRCGTIFQQVESESFDVVILSPMWHVQQSQVQFSTSGPKPLRTSICPRGFPWLRNHDAEQVQLANLFVDRSIDLALTQVGMGGFFLFEHPEQLKQSRLATFLVLSGTFQARES